MEYMGDVHTIQTFDGEVLSFPDADNRLLVYIGYGAPPIDYITQRGYKQHGETKLDYLLAPRTVTLDLWKKPACSRIEYWQNRAALHDLLRPNRGGSLQLTLTMPDGSQRSIYLDPQPGAQFDTPQTEDNNWEINESLDFIAFDPVWFNPSQTVRAVAENATQNLVFPIVFPIEFGTGGVVFTATINYAGSWRSYPTIVLTGPYDHVILTNAVTGAVISLIVPIAAGQSRTLDLTPGAISIVDENGDTVFDELSDTSDLVDFSIEPNPIAPNGVNTIITNIFGATAATTLTIEYRERYYAL